MARREESEDDIEDRVETDRYGKILGGLLGQYDEAEQGDGTSK